MKTQKDKISRILFITLSNLGDIILTTPVLEKLHDEFPNAKFDIITGLPGKEIFDAYPAAGEVIVPERPRSFGKRIKQLLYLRKKKYDIVIDLKNSLIPYLVGTKFHSSLTLPGKKALTEGGASPVLHKRDEHLSKISFLGVDTSRSRFFLPQKEEYERSVDKILGQTECKLSAVISPGSKSHLKRWPPEKYGKLADKLIRDLKCRVFLVGSEEDAATIRDVISNMEEYAVNLCSRTPLGILAELMRRVDLVITNDSAPLHIASAVNTPTIAIFAPTDERKYGPLADMSRVISSREPCRPCDRSSCAKGENKECIKNIRLDEVFSAAKEILQLIPGIHGPLRGRRKMIGSGEFCEEEDTPFL
ncbi:MAG: glycosyltransferase family 9 protein [Candidatus Omnitrophica bacterium]|nr:glycosyltransferase family 9 protein [Candidatus Omnitrophota bacterium]